MTTHVLERREQLRPLLRAAADAEALKRGGERPCWSGCRFPAEEVDMQDWRNMLKHAQELRRTARCSAPAMAKERQEESCETLREKREALRQRRIRTSDIASLAQIKKNSTRWRSSSSARKSLSGCR